MIQKSYNKSDIGNLYIVPTPIGNMEDITLRAINTLKMVDIVFAEDTRITSVLLKSLNINKKIESCHKYSEMKNKDKIVKIIKEGKNVALVTDRGTPLISDPGNIVVSECIKNNINVISLPGPNALLPAINMSGLSNERFLFYGFLDNKESLIKKELESLKDVKYTLIFYEAPHRIKKTLNIMLNVLGDRSIALVREISKIYEEVIRDSISNVIKECDRIKGEIVIVVDGSKEIHKEKNYIEMVNKLIKAGVSKSTAIKIVSSENGISKNKLYDQCKE